MASLPTSEPTDHSCIGGSSGMDQMYFSGRDRKTADTMIQGHATVPTRIEQLWKLHCSYKLSGEYGASMDLTELKQNVTVYDVTTENKVQRDLGNFDTTVVQYGIIRAQEAVIAALDVRLMQLETAFGLLTGAFDVQSPMPIELLSSGDLDRKSVNQFADSSIVGNINMALYTSHSGDPDLVPNPGNRFCFVNQSPTFDMIIDFKTAPAFPTVTAAPVLVMADGAKSSLLRVQPQGKVCIIYINGLFEVMSADGCLFV